MVPIALLASTLFLQVAGSGLDHRALACAEVDRFVRLEARVEPAAAVGSARIYFRAPGPGEWYWVSMRVEGDALHGVLPKPTRRLAAFDYYIEVIGFHMATARTPEVTVRVEPGCHDMGLVLAVATAPVVVGVSGAGLPFRRLREADRSSRSRSPGRSPEGRHASRSDSTFPFR